MDIAWQGIRHWLSSELPQQLEDLSLGVSRVVSVGVVL
jgi:hypothetical protein